MVVAVTSFELVALIIGTVDLDVSVGEWGRPLCTGKGRRATMIVLVDVYMGGGFGTVFNESRDSDAESCASFFSTTFLFRDHGIRIFPFPLNSRFVNVSLPPVVELVPLPGKIWSSVDMEDTEE